MSYSDELNEYFTKHCENKGKAKIKRTEVTAKKGNAWLVTYNQLSRQLTKPLNCRPMTIEEFENENSKELDFTSEFIETDRKGKPIKTYTFTCPKSEIYKLYEKISDNDQQLAKLLFDAEGKVAQTQLLEILKIFVDAIGTLYAQFKKDEIHERCIIRAQSLMKEIKGKRKLTQTEENATLAILRALRFFTIEIFEHDTGNTRVEPILNYCIVEKIHNANDFYLEIISEPYIFQDAREKNRIEQVKTEQMEKANKTKHIERALREYVRIARANKTKKGFFHIDNEFKRENELIGENRKSRSARNHYAKRVLKVLEKLQQEGEIKTYKEGKAGKTVIKYYFEVTTKTRGFKKKENYSPFL